VGIALKCAATLLPAALLAGCAITKDCPPANSPVFDDAAVWNYPPRVLLKNWALSACLAKITQDTDTKRDAARTANGYAEYGVMSLEEIDEMTSLIDEYIAKKYEGHTETGERPSTFDTMKCIDMFYSAELDAMAGKFLMTDRPARFRRFQPEHQGKSALFKED
jgi:hypothetical protein